jgi:tRNA 5-methylaminomethyl-2-thiouridine biosynthesis bifunctional protein
MTPLQCSHVIIACATASRQIEQLSHIPLKSIRGQITEVAETESSRILKTTICGEGYAAPAFNQRHTIGATFDFQSDSTEVLDAEHNKNLSMQADWANSFYEAIGGETAHVLGGRASFRCTTPDYLPVVGAVIEKDAFIEDFAMLRKNTKYRFTKHPVYQEGLYINAGHGSRGLITCPLAGELLAAILNNEPSPIPADLLDHLNPNRFLVRGLSSGKL